MDMNSSCRSITWASYLAKSIRSEKYFRNHRCYVYIYIYVKIHGRYTTYRVCSRVFFVVQVLYRYWLHGSRNQKTGVKGWKFEDVVPPTVEIEDESESKRNGLQTSTNPCLLVQGPIWPNLAGWSWIPILGVSLKWWYPPFHTAKNEDF